MLHTIAIISSACLVLFGVFFGKITITHGTGTRVGRASCVLSIFCLLSAVGLCALAYYLRSRI